MTNDPGPTGVVHVDLDGARAIHRAHDWDHSFEQDTLFETGLAGALDFFGEVGVTATLFVIAEDLSVPAHRRLLERAVEEGHEIASHSFTHRGLAGLSAGEKDREIRGSRVEIEDRLGTPVRGFRAPAYDIDRDCVERIAEAGYSWDSSLFPSRKFARLMEADDIPPVPHRALPDRELMEIPLPGHAPLPWPFHPCYSLILGRAYFGLGLARFRRTGAPLVLLFHLTDFAEPVPGLRGRRRIFTLSHLSGEKKRSRCRAMLDRVRRHYRLETTAELVRRSATDRTAARGGAPRR